MYKNHQPRKRLGKLSNKKNTSLSQYVKILCNVNQLKVDYPLQNDLKVVIAAGLTSSHPEQSS